MYYCCCYYLYNLYGHLFTGGSRCSGGSVRRCDLGSVRDEVAGGNSRAPVHIVAPGAGRHIAVAPALAVHAGRAHSTRVIIIDHEHAG